MELTLDVLNSLFPHSDTECLGDNYVVKAPWCNVSITSERASMELLNQVPSNWGFSGNNWQERFIEKVVEFESMSPFFLIGHTKQGSLHLRSSCCVTRTKDIRSVSSAFYNVWRGWSGELLLCSQQFHQEYLW